MIKKKVLIFGSTGQIGRHLIRKLTKNNYSVVCHTRNSHKAVFLKTSGSIGYIDIVESDIFNFEKIDKLIQECDICINLIGILFESGKKNTFKNIHVNFPKLISSICKNNNKHLINISALALDKAKDSKYASSKIEGENIIKKNIQDVVIIKPSIVFSVMDSFSTKFMSMLNILPFFPLYYGGKTKYSPIHASDLTNLIYHVITNEIKNKEIEAIGPEILTFKEMLQILIKGIGKKRLLLPLPLSLAKFTAYMFEYLPKPIITLDQLRLLKYDNIKSEKGITNYDIGCPSKVKFEEGILKYSYNWREGGQFSVKNLKKNNL